MNRRSFIGSAFSALVISAIGPIPAHAFNKACKKNCKKGIDEDLIVFLSDLHTDPNGYQPGLLKKIVEDILAMTPRPRNIIALGDLAFLTGQVCEYEGLKPILAPLEEAGITLTLAMGNHDRRAEFAQVFPEQAAKSLMKDRLVYKVETTHADFIILDSLQESEDKKKWITPGSLNEEQKEWLKKELAAATKPVFVCSHHPLNETRIASILSNSPTCCGYIFGHMHTWTKDWIECWEKGRRATVRTLCLPSTGHWGDIGYVTMELNQDTAEATMHQKDFFFPNPAKDPAAVPAQWKIYVEENNGDKCTFSLK